jgi:alternative ribosome-rescue factor
MTFALTLCICQYCNVLINLDDSKIQPTTLATDVMIFVPKRGGYMAKKPPKQTAVEHGRGEIRDNALKALVTGPLFRMRVVKAKKGKGAYQRYQRGQKNDNSALFFAQCLIPISTLN